MKGLTLPIWVVAAAKSATLLLAGESLDPYQKVDLPEENRSFSVPISSGALLEGGKKALVRSYCESGLALDITRGLEIWASVEFLSCDSYEITNSDKQFPNWLNVVGGFGVGKLESTHQISISTFASKLLIHNLDPLRPKGSVLNLELIFPAGKDLALCTSNKAFGVVDGLALIGTQAEAQVSASPNQLKDCIEALRIKCSDSSFNGLLTFVIGSNGLDLANQFGIPSSSILKIGNWVGPLLVAAAEEGVEKLLLFGYHGKLIKLAGGIFHTHHHLADGRLEVLTALAFHEKIPLEVIRLINTAKSVEDALLSLETQNSYAIPKLWGRIANEVENKSQEYINRYISSSIEVGSILFDRQRKVRWAGSRGRLQLDSMELSLQSQS